MMACLAVLAILGVGSEPIGTPPSLLPTHPLSAHSGSEPEPIGTPPPLLPSHPLSAHSGSEPEPIGTSPPLLPSHPLSAHSGSEPEPIGTSLPLLPSYPLSARCASSGPAEPGAPRIAIGIFGLAYRNLPATLPSFEQNLFGVLDRAAIKYEVFLHAMLVLTEALQTRGVTLSADLLQGRKPSDRIALDPYSFVLLRPCIFEVEDQGLALKRLQGRRGRLPTKMPDLWKDNYHSVNNYLIALHSLERLGKLISERERSVGALFNLVLVLRADTRLLCPTDLPQRADAILAREAVRLAPIAPGAPPVGGGIVAIPTWGSYGGANDRFVFGARDAVLSTYLNRSEPAWESFVAGAHPRNSEQMLMRVMRAGHVDVKHTAMVVQRVRATGLGSPTLLTTNDRLEFLRNDLERGLPPLVQQKAKASHKPKPSSDEICQLARAAVQALTSWNETAIEGEGARD
jgi:hypothetical protein